MFFNLSRHKTKIAERTQAVHHKAQSTNIFKTGKMLEKCVTSDTDYFDGVDINIHD